MDSIECIGHKTGLIVGVVDCDRLIHREILVFQIAHQS